MQTSPIIYQVILVAIFIVIFLEVYLLEFKLIVRFFLNKFVRKTETKDFFSPGNICIHAIALIGLLCSIYGFFIEPYAIQVNTITIVTDKLKNTKLRIVQISDLHCDTKIRNEKKLARLINPLNPDIIVFTGDAINTRQAIPVFKAALGSLNAKIGKFAVAGNIDVAYWHDTDLYANTGFQLLNKKSLALAKDGETFYISGLTYKYWSQWSDVLKKIPDGHLSIFLCHIPDVIEKIKDVNMDLYLAGHTHGGQISLPFFGALITMSHYGKKYEAGLYKAGKTILYVNRGIGMEGGFAPRARFLSRPEITVFNIVPKRSKHF